MDDNFNESINIQRINSHGGEFFKRIMEQFNQFFIIFIEFLNFGF